MTTEKVLQLLAETPLRLAETTRGVGEAALRSSPAPGEWSANDVLAHLRSCADVWGGCIGRILEEDAPTLRAVNPRTYIAQTDYPELAFGPSFAAFAEQRAQLLAALEPLSPQDWSRAATVTGAGRPSERTVRAYAERLASHERAHVTQVVRVMAAVRC